VGERRWGCLMPALLSLAFIGLLFFLLTAVFGLVIL
jgi:hypothetical protein